VKKLLSLALAVALAVAAAGCTRVAHPERGTGDAPVDTAKVDATAPQILEMPNLFGNVAAKCDGHGHRVYVTTGRDSYPAHLFVIDDPACTAPGR
jgi:hypothetical protein